LRTLGLSKKRPYGHPKSARSAGQFADIYLAAAILDFADLIFG
jgi:hypothetical protein